MTVNLKKRDNELRDALHIAYDLFLIDVKRRARAKGLSRIEMNNIAWLELAESALAYVMFNVRGE